MVKFTKQEFLANILLLKENVYEQFQVARFCIIFLYFCDVKENRLVFYEDSTFWFWGGEEKTYRISS